jgi:flavin reductase (DIM6/NTAB) family NADH-FMN oxidoreductase RutF
MAPLAEALRPYRYLWPTEDLAADPRWAAGDGGRRARSLPESPDELAADSRWPAFFPSPLCLVTARHGGTAVLEKVVGASIVNRFPYVVALSFCARDLSARHHARAPFMRVLEASGEAAVQFLPPGPALDRAMAAIGEGGAEGTADRLRRAGLATRRGAAVGAPVLAEAHLVYEARLVRAGRDLDGAPIYPRPWIDVGSHRVYFLEVRAIQLRRDVAEGRARIHWRSLPAWRPPGEGPPPPAPAGGPAPGPRYQKTYTPHYAFPSAGTIAFEADGIADGMAVKTLPSEAADQVEVDNDRARWPCFFPSSVGMITAWSGDRPNLMPCGSTTVVSRDPLVVTPCIGYAAINERYARRSTLDLVRTTGAFACGVPYVDDRIVAAITYAGNVSLPLDVDKVARTGLTVVRGERAPILADLPVTFECELMDEVRLGTHAMCLGRVRRIVVRPDVTPAAPLEWCPWADVRAVDAAG